MALTSTNCRMLIVVNGINELTIITLPKDYGGFEPRAKVTIDQLRSTLTKTLDLQDTSLHILNGIEEG